MKRSLDTTRGDTFRENLQSYMDSVGMSHNGTSKKSGVSQKTIWAVCSGRSVPTLNTAESVANAAGVDASVLQIKPLSPSQVERSKKVARLMSEVIELSAADLKTVIHVVAAMREPEGTPRVKQYALLPEVKDE